MREIKFSGKRIDKKGWVDGYYFKTPLTDEATNSKPEDGWFLLSGRERHCISKDNCVYEVIPETVSQYTGLRDKNKKEIRENNIVKIKYFRSEYIGKVVYNEKTCGFEIWYNSTVGAYGEKATHKINFAMDIEVEIIGNIHDNLEL